jgi:hypothetical protein
MRSFGTGAAVPSVADLAVDPHEDTKTRGILGWQRSRE